MTFHTTRNGRSHQIGTLRVSARQARALAVRALIERVHAEKRATGDLVGRERVGRIFMRPETLVGLMAQIITRAALDRGAVTIEDFTAAGLAPAQARTYGLAAYHRATAADPDVARALGGLINLLASDVKE